MGQTLIFTCASVYSQVHRRLRTRAGEVTAPKNSVLAAKMRRQLTERTSFIIQLTIHSHSLPAVRE